MAADPEMDHVSDDSLQDGHAVDPISVSARTAIGEAYTFLRSRKLTGRFTLDSAVQDRIEEIEGVAGAPGLLDQLDEVTSKLEQAIKEISNGT